jgi:hypothetical protein
MEKKVLTDEERKARDREYTKRYLAKGDNRIKKLLRNREYMDKIREEDPERIRAYQREYMRKYRAKKKAEEQSQEKES